MSGPTVIVAVQGEPGCNSALAADEYFAGQEVELLPCHSFLDLFNAVKAGTAAHGMAPVENSLGGSVLKVWDLLSGSDLPICGEIYFHVRHCLIAHPGVPVQQIRFVYSHEQALAQCRRYLQKLVWIDADDIIPAYDTAGAVKMIKARGRREEAAIASPQAAEIYGMQVLAEDIQTDPRNHTRFLVLNHHPCPRTDIAGKTTLILALEACARDLPELLATLANRKIELLKLETRKALGRPWEYQIYLECAGAVGEPALDEALEKIKKRAAALRVIGSYPMAPVPGNQAGTG